MVLVKLWGNIFMKWDTCTLIIDPKLRLAIFNKILSV